MSIHNLNCRFCGDKTGEIQLPEGITPADVGIVESRCDGCIARHGRYQELEREYKENVSSDHSDFLNAISEADFSRDKLVTVIEEAKEAKQDVGNKEDRVREEKD